MVATLVWIGLCFCFRPCSPLSSIERMQWQHRYGPVLRGTQRKWLKHWCGYILVVGSTPRPQPQAPPISPPPSPSQASQSQALVSLDMVLTFHHKGLVEEFAAAKAVIDSHIALGFVGPAYLRPTSVPCKLGPRNVVMQERSRPLPSGGVEFFLKPRVTFNLSYGINHDAADMPTNPTKHNRYRIPPVNGCVPDEAAEITLQRAAAESSSMMRLASRHCAEWCCWRQQTRCS